jgi:hypothetical protein
MLKGSEKVPKVVSLKDVTAVYLDGGLLTSINLLLSGWELLPLHIYNLSAFSEAFVLYDALIPSFNTITPSEPSQCQIQTHCINQGIFFQLNNDLTDKYKSEIHYDDPRYWFEGGAHVPLYHEYLSIYLLDSMSDISLEKMESSIHQFQVLQQLRNRA